MYKVEYDTVAIMTDGTNGNVSQGKRVAFMHCTLEVMAVILEKHLKGKETSLYPIIKKVTSVPGEIVL